eukprot:TRINITY_DN7501_c0_g1_i3.p1 TRINITY_DN7501_c0_g1~~TRINITY_DN7501_c0_g1_i3.p1  ORF type:complete len:145 (-),score=18.40 TRINITY_DN7501_c0_g1_i3:369-803(-)
MEPRKLIIAERIQNTKLTTLLLSKHCSGRVSRTTIPDYIFPDVSFSFTIIDMDPKNHTNLSRLSKVASLHLKKSYVLVSVPFEKVNDVVSFMNLQRLLPPKLTVIPTCEAPLDVATTIMDLVHVREKVGDGLSLDEVEDLYRKY